LRRVLEIVDLRLDLCWT